MKPLNLMLLFFIFSSLQSTCQVFLLDNFSDGDFYQSPAWTGNDSSFLINDNLQLQLNASTAGNAYLATQINLNLPDIDWEFFVKMSLSPSTNNNARIALFVTTNRIDSLPDGLWVQLGEAGSNDAIRLIARINQVDSVLCSGPSAQIAAPFSFCIKISLISGHIWKIYSKTINQAYFSCLASANFPISTGNGFFGILCKFTSSNLNNFIFDNITIQPHPFDTSPPLLLKAQIIPPSSLSIQYSEPTDSSSSFQLYNYSIGNPPYYPKWITSGLKENCFTLTFDSSFIHNQYYPLHISYIYDKEGNKIHDTTLQVIYWDINCFDVIINEIMADPDPEIELPPVEYIELYNRSSHPVDLSSWIVTIGSSNKILPEFTLIPFGYVILIPAKDSLFYPNKSNTIYLKSLSISNTGSLITLSDQNGNQVHAIQYTAAQHDQANKKEGGWSLEMIDPTNPCEPTNWKSSIDPSGGTPAYLNSVFDNNPDNTAPTLLRSRWIDSTHFIISASETIDSLTLIPPPHFALTPQTSEISAIQTVKPLNQELLFNTNHPLDTLTSYTISTLDTIKDCSGNLLALPVSISLGKPFIPRNNEIIINEILTNPLPDQTDYLELVNNTDSFLDLNKVILNYRSSSSEITTITLPKVTINPHEYLLLSRTPEKLKEQYNIPYKERLVFCNSLPDFSSSSGTIVLSLTNNQSIVIDSFNYTSELYPALINSTDGVSLERVNPLRPTNEPTNWQVASTTNNYGTPGYLNSQYCVIPDGEGKLLISPKIFSPKLPNLEHSVSLKIKSNDPGSFATLTIYNINGQRVITIINHELIGTEAIYSWNGLTENGLPSPTGYYLVMLQLYNSNGKTEILKGQIILTQ